MTPLPKPGRHLLQWKMAGEGACAPASMVFSVAASRSCTNLASSSLPSSFALRTKSSTLDQHAGIGAFGQAHL